MQQQIEEWIYYSIINSLGYYSIIKRNGLIYATKMNSHASCWEKAAYTKNIWLHLYEILEKAKLMYNERKKISDCLELLVQRHSQSSTRELFGCLKCFYIFIVLFPSVYAFVEIHQTLCIKWYILLYVNYTSKKLILKWLIYVKFLAQYLWHKKYFKNGRY